MEKRRITARHRPWMVARVALTSRQARGDDDSP
jgi:hypothetical protein